MKKIIFIIISFVVIGAFAQDYKTLIKNVPGADKYPDASAINVFTKVDVEVSKDGTSKKHVYYVKKILTYKGKSKYSDVKIDYDAKIESVELGECFSVRDGKKIEIPKEAIHDNGTFLTMYSPEYINQRQKVVNFPAIEPNDFIVVDYVITRKPNDYFSGVEHMQEENPYLKKIFSITALDKSTKLSYKAADGVKESSTTKDGKITTTWTVENMPAIKDEKNKPSFLIIGKPVFYSAMANWKQAADVYFKQFTSVNYNTKEVAALVKDFANSKMTNELKLKKIYAYIQDNFEFKYALNDDGYVPENASKVLNQKFGGAKELTALFIAMAKAANVIVEPVLPIWGRDIPEFKQITCSRAVGSVYAYYNGTLIGFNTQYMPYGTTWIEKSNLIKNDGTGKLIDYNFDVKPLVNRGVTVKFNKDFTADASFTKILKGKEDYVLRRSFKNETEKKRKIWFTSDISDKSINVVGEPEFKNIGNYSNNLEISFNAKINNFYNTQDNYIYLKLPEPEDIDIDLTGSSRENPYQVRSAISFIEKYTFENVPAGFKVIKPKNPIVKTYKEGDVTMSFKISSLTEGNNIIVVREVFIPKTIVSKENYPKFAKFIGEAKKPLNNMVFLSK